MPPAVKPIEKLRPPIASKRRSRIGAQRVGERRARAMRTPQIRHGERAPASATTTAMPATANVALLADEIREQAAAASPIGTPMHDRGAHEARGAAALRRPGRVERERLRRDEHARRADDRGAAGLRGSTRPGCPVDHAEEIEPDHDDLDREPTSSVRRPPNRSAIMPISGLATTRTARFAARMRPMNGSDSPTRNPTIGKIGKTMPPATPASSVPGARASASERGRTTARSEGARKSDGPGFPGPFAQRTDSRSSRLGSGRSRNEPPASGYSDVSCSLVLPWHIARTRWRGPPAELQRLPASGLHDGRYRPVSRPTSRGVQMVIACVLGGQNRPHL